MSTEIHESDIDEIALGAAVLGTGGGGDPHVGSLMAKRLIRQHGPARLLAVEDISNDDFVLPGAGQLLTASGLPNSDM